MNIENIYKSSNLNKSSLNKLDWQLIQNEMKKKLGSEVYESWLKKIDFIEEFQNYILISVSTRFIRDWITSRYLDQILKIIKTYKKEINRIEFTISNNFGSFMLEWCLDFSPKSQLILISILSIVKV